MLVIAVMIGGALGALSRYLTTLGIQGWLGGMGWASFPLATLVVNIVGSFLLSLLATLGLRGFVSPTLQVALGTGFLGSLTTFSTFELETHTLLSEGKQGFALVYVLASLVLGYLAILLGRAIAQRIGGNV